MQEVTTNSRNYLLVIINGPNLNYLGKREPHIYGNQTLAEIESQFLENLIPNCQLIGLNDKIVSNITRLDVEEFYKRKDLEECEDDRLINLFLIRKSLVDFGQFSHASIKSAISYFNIDKKYLITPITFQSNYEGDILDFIYHILDLSQSIECTPLFVINPAAYGHTSLALRDCLLATKIKFVEVHISNPYNRESYRRYSYTNDLALKVFSGYGTEGYNLAVQYLLESEIKI